jgi:ParB-like chromosome segregation protein Spo0J
MTRTIEYIPIEDLKENPRNVKDHEIPTVTASISRFGVIDPIVVDARTGYIVSGHGRRQTLLNMRDAGELPPEGVILEGEGKNRTWLVPVLTGW